MGLSSVLTDWNWQPSIIGGTLLVTGLYCYAVGPLRAKLHLAESVSMRQVVLFLLGVGFILLALFSPLDALGDHYLFSAHMLQHLILTFVGPPLMLLGTPGWLLKPLLRNHVLFRLGKIVTSPVVAFTLLNVDFFLWHAPSLYDATLYNDNLHILEHLTFIVFGVIYWWPVLSPLSPLDEGLPRLSPGGQILYLFFSGMPSVLLGAGLTFAPPLYTPYIHAPRIWNISPATDQQLGGLLMWVPVSLYMIAIMSVLFIRWIQQLDKKQREEEMRQDEQDERNRLAALEIQQAQANEYAKE